MRLIGPAAALMLALPPSAWADQAPIGLPAHGFAPSWTALSTLRFSSDAQTAAPVTLARTHAVSIDDARMRVELDAAIASAADARGRRELGWNELMTPWTQARRVTFQRLRDAETTYAADDDRAAARFAALVTGIVNGTGRSAAFDGSAASARDIAFGAALLQEDEDARRKTNAAQQAFLAYRAAFVAFADERSPGTGEAIGADLDRQRAADLGATSP